jgi:hypothetical protein
MKVKTILVMVMTAMMLANGGCASRGAAPPPSPIEGPNPNPAEVRGYLMGTDGGVPKDAAAFAAPVLRDHLHAVNLCLALRERVNLNTTITPTTPTTVNGKKVTPLVWMLSLAGKDISALQRAGQLQNCDSLAANYDRERADRIRKQAQAILRQAGLDASALNGKGPFIIVATRNWANVVIYDMSQAPVIDYSKWVEDMTVDLERLDVMQGSEVATANMRDRIRFFVFKSVPYVQSALAVVL